MACSLLTRLSRATHTSTHPPALAPLSGTHGNHEQQTESRLAKFRLLWTAVKKGLLPTTMKPDQYDSVVIPRIPGWLDQAHIEKWIATIPDIVQVRRRTNTAFFDQYDLIFDFSPGANTYLQMTTSTHGSKVIFDHSEFDIYPVNVPYDPKTAVVVSKLELTHNPNQLDNSQLFRRLKLGQVAPKKTECCICRDELVASFSTPCWSCNRAECYNCLQNHFRTALVDFERFPAKCCEVVFHPDVAKGVLPEVELLKYKARFEEWISRQPFYCPVLTCSMFIPPRRLRKLGNKVVECHACHSSICVTCKQLAHIGQACKDEGQKAEDLAILTKFGYKQCPRCGIAVGKMYGCSHVQCKCGAHWCWECRRKIEVCSLSPCDGSFEDGYGDYLSDRLSDIDSVSDEDNEPAPNLRNMNDSDSSLTESLETSLATPRIQNTAQVIHPVNNSDQSGIETRRPHDTPTSDALNGQISNASLAIVPISTVANAELTHAESPNSHHDETLNNSAPQQLTNQIEIAPDPQAINLEPSEAVNLDDPRATAWDTMGLYFGEEPHEEDSLDVWGCVHSFEPASYNKVPRYWMTASVPDWWDRDPCDREIDCMICWRTTKLAPKPGEIEKLEDTMERRKKIKDWRFARRCRKCSIIVCRRCRNDLTK